MAFSDTNQTNRIDLKLVAEMVQSGTIAVGRGPRSITATAVR